MNFQPFDAKLRFALLASLRSATPKFLLIRSADPSSSKTADPFPFQRTFDSDDLSEILSNPESMRILFVRNPLSRFCTAWGQKFRVGGEYQQHREDWLSSWPDLRQYEKENTANIIGFGDFVDFFQNVTPTEFNSHWNTILGGD